MQGFLDKAMLASRWILAAFYLGLAFALAVYAVRFVYKLWKFALAGLSAPDTQMLIDLLYLLDSALVASLVAMVAISSYDSLVSQLSTGDGKGKLSWVTTLDPGNLKVKLSTALVAISSIHLLQIFMDVREYDDRAVTWAVVIHGMFLLGAVALGVMDKFGGKKGQT